MSKMISTKLSRDPEEFNQIYGNRHMEKRENRLSMQFFLDEVPNGNYGHIHGHRDVILVHISSHQQWQNVYFLQTPGQTALLTLNHNPVYMYQEINLIKP